MDDNPRGEWPAELSRHVGAAIQAAREAQDVSAVKLAARTAELGYPIHRVAISKLESGKRDITVPELVILAAALNTVPLALLATDAPDEPVEILPSNEMTGASAIGWFTGSTSAAPAGVTRDRSVTQRLELTMKLNEVNELLEIQRHNLFQVESSLQTFTMPDAFRERQQETVRHTRDLVKSLEGQRDSILYMLAHQGDWHGG
jgi:transcriptional regulator with XRE-family HTH domain